MQQGLVVLAPGALFASDYRVVRPLGQGGMGAVYVVEQLSTGKKRALKLMLPQLGADPELRRRFEQEARIGARIESEHVVEVQGAGVDQATGAPYLVMELLDGEDLATTIARRGAISIDELRGIFSELCHALGAAHAAGIVHRDLKPENVFLAKSHRATGAPFTVKVLDFGIAKLASAATQGRATRAMGSPMWMAPEQTEEGAVTPAADVWALGLLAFHALTGTFFWRAAAAPESTMAQLFREIVLEPIPAASLRAREHRADGRIPPSFDAWFARCVVRDVASRFPNASEAWRALERDLVPFGATAVDARSNPPPPMATPSAMPSGMPQGTPVPTTPHAGSGAGSGPVASPAFSAPPPHTMPQHRGATPAPVSSSLSPSPRSKRVPVAVVALIALASSGVGVRAIVAARIAKKKAIEAAAALAEREKDDDADKDDAPPVASPQVPPASSLAIAPLGSSIRIDVPMPKGPLLGPDGPLGPSGPLGAARGAQNGSTGAKSAPSAAPLPSFLAAATDDPPAPPAPPNQVPNNVSNTHIATVAGHKVRLIGRIVKNDGNVADPVIRKAVEWDAWQYLRCYDSSYAARPVLQTGAISVSFEVKDQLPRFAKVFSSEFAEPRFNDCIVGTLTGETINAAGPEGSAKVIYSFRFVVMN